MNIIIYFHQQIAMFRQVFNFLDKTKCGLVSCEKLGELVRISGLNPTEAEIANIKSRYSEKTGITFDEYIKLLSSLDCVGCVLNFSLMNSNGRGYTRGIQSIRQIQRRKN